MRLALAEIARVLDVPFDGAPDAVCEGAAIDTRALQPGDLFFALRGTHTDGHQFVASAFERGAAAAVVEQEVAAPGPLLRVSSTLEALTKLATWTRCRWGGQVVGVTGSCGKTTAKEAIAACLATSLPIGKNAGNLNNHLGVPLSILNLPDEARVAVLEMGMNHAGEIRALCEIAAPRTGVVTNVGYAHIEAFESIEGIAEAKRELIDSLPPDGTAVLNADDPRVDAFASGHPGRVVRYGLSPGADVRAEGMRLTPEGSCFSVGGVAFQTKLPGHHNVQNILAGIAVARLFDIPLERLPAAVAALDPGPMRGERFTHNGIIIWNDSYNSNPDAARAVLDLVRSIPAERRIAVLGEMLELGRWAETLHSDVGCYAAASGFDVLIGISGAARFMVGSARQAGLPDSAACFFPTPEEAGEHLRRIARPGDLILFKGSRGTRVERALERFLEG
jgi:UDP-N-acetylmuramoyl-tripeptide--D-alanyl-D-alanine ligase